MLKSFTAKFGTVHVADVIKKLPEKVVAIPGRVEAAMHRVGTTVHSQKLSYFQFLMIFFFLIHSYCSLTALQYFPHILLHKKGMQTNVQTTNINNNIARTTLFKV